MGTSEIAAWLEQDESPNFGGTFCIDKAELIYLVSVLDLAIKAPNFQFNATRLKKITKMREQFKNKLGEGYEAEKIIDHT